MKGAIAQPKFSAEVNKKLQKELKIERNGYYGLKLVAGAFHCTLSQMMVVFQLLGLSNALVLCKLD